MASSRDFIQHWNTTAKRLTTITESPILNSALYWLKQGRFNDVNGVILFVYITSVAIRKMSPHTDEKWKKIGGINAPVVSHLRFIEANTSSVDDEWWANVVGGLQLFRELRSSWRTFALQLIAMKHWSLNQFISNPYKRTLLVNKYIEKIKWHELRDACLAIGTEQCDFSPFTTEWDLSTWISIRDMASSDKPMRNVSDLIIDEHAIEPLITSIINEIVGLIKDTSTIIHINQVILFLTDVSSGGALEYEDFNESLISYLTSLFKSAATRKVDINMDINKFDAIRQFAASPLSDVIDLLCVRITLRVFVCCASAIELVAGRADEITATMEPVQARMREHLDAVRPLISEIKRGEYLSAANQRAIGDLLNLYDLVGHERPRRPLDTILDQWSLASDPTLNWVYAAVVPSESVDDVISAVSTCVARQLETGPVQKLIDTLKSVILSLDDHKVRMELATTSTIRRIRALTTSIIPTASAADLSKILAPNVMYSLVSVDDQQSEAVEVLQHKLVQETDEMPLRRLRESLLIDALRTLNDMNS